LEGEEVQDAELYVERLSEEDSEAPWMNLTVGSEHFSCTTCHLVLDGYELLQEAGLPSDFADIGDIGDYIDSGEYGND
jgi:hypothetical protein